MKSILVALTNIPTYGEKNAATGLWLGEAAEFVDEVGKRGYAVDYVSPQGGYVPLDPRSMKRTYADAATFALYRSPSRVRCAPTTWKRKSTLRCTTRVAME